MTLQLPLTGVEPKQQTTARQCIICGRAVARVRLRTHLVCVTVQLQCPNCGRQFTRTLAELNKNTPDRGYRRAFGRCSMDCRRRPRTAPCTRCGKEFQLSPAQASQLGRGLQSRVFCPKCISSKARLTRCQRGHAFNEENTLIHHGPTAIEHRCRACRNLQARKRRSAKQATA